MRDLSTIEIEGKKASAYQSYKLEKAENTKEKKKRGRRKKENIFSMQEEATGENTSYENF